MKPNLFKKAIWIILSASCASTSVWAVQSNVSTVDAAAKSKGFTKQVVNKGQHRSFAWPYLTTATTFQYYFALNQSAIYLHNDADQWDYNKLPGFGDCGSIDLSRNGAMFGWRWDPNRQMVSVSAYANKAGFHQNKDTAFARVTDFELSADDLAVFNPLLYTIKIQGDKYLFNVSGRLASGRTINANAELDRGCAVRPAQIKVGSHLYFGGTKVAPHDVSGYVRWVNR